MLVVAKHLAAKSGFFRTIGVCGGVTEATVYCHRRVAWRTYFQDLKTGAGEGIFCTTYAYPSRTNVNFVKFGPVVVAQCWVFSFSVM